MKITTLSEEGSAGESFRERRDVYLRGGKDYYRPLRDLTVSAQAQDRRRRELARKTATVVLYDIVRTREASHD